MPTGQLIVVGPPAIVNTNLAAIITAITGSGATLSGAVEASGGGDITSNPAILVGLTTVFHARIIFPLNMTRAILDALVTALGPVKTGAPTLRFDLSYTEPVTV